MCEAVVTFIKAVQLIYNNKLWIYQVRYYLMYVAKEKVWIIKRS